MALVNINFTVLAHAYVLYARALQSRIRGGTFAAPVRPALKSGTAMRTTVKSGTAFAVPAGPSTPPLHNDQHTYAMSLLKKQHALSADLVPSSYAPIAQAFARPSDEEREKLRAKFDIAYFVGVEIFRSRNIRTFVSWKLVTECRLARLM